MWRTLFRRPKLSGKNDKKNIWMQDHFSRSYVYAKRMVHFLFILSLQLMLEKIYCEGIIVV